MQINLRILTLASSSLVGIRWAQAESDLSRQSTFSECWINNQKTIDPSLLIEGTDEAPVAHLTFSNGYIQTMSCTPVENGRSTCEPPRSNQAFPSVIYLNSVEVRGELVKSAQYLMGFGVGEEPEIIDFKCR
jgi:hypothetical protein